MTLRYVVLLLASLLARDALAGIAVGPPIPPPPSSSGLPTRPPKPR